MRSFVNLRIVFPPRAGQNQVWFWSGLLDLATLRMHANAIARQRRLTLLPHPPCPRLPESLSFRARTLCCPLDLELSMEICEFGANSATDFSAVGAVVVLVVGGGVSALWLVVDLGVLALRTTATTTAAGSAAEG